MAKQVVIKKADLLKLLDDLPSYPIRDLDDDSRGALTILFTVVRALVEANTNENWPIVQ